MCTPWDQGCLQANPHSHTVTSPCEEEASRREEEIGGLPGSLQRVRPGVHRRDQEELKDPTG